MRFVVGNRSAGTVVVFVSELTEIVGEFVEFVVGNVLVQGEVKFVEDGVDVSGGEFSVATVTCADPVLSPVSIPVRGA